MLKNTKKLSQPLQESYRGNGLQIPTYSKPAPMPRKVNPVSKNNIPDPSKKK